MQISSVNSFLINSDFKLQSKVIYLVELFVIIYQLANLIYRLYNLSSKYMSAILPVLSLLYIELNKVNLKNEQNGLDILVILNHDW